MRQARAGMILRIARLPPEPTATMRTICKGWRPGRETNEPAARVGVPLPRPNAHALEPRPGSSSGLANDLETFLGSEPPSACARSRGDRCEHCNADAAACSILPNGDITSLISGALYESPPLSGEIRPPGCPRSCTIISAQAGDERELYRATSTKRLPQPPISTSARDHRQGRRQLMTRGARGCLKFRARSRRRSNGFRVALGVGWRHQAARERRRRHPHWLHI